jgi:hypothetical protein
MSTSNPHHDHHDHGHPHHDHGHHHDSQKGLAFDVSLMSQSALMRCAFVVAILVPLWIAVLWVIRS